MLIIAKALAMMHYKERGKKIYKLVVERNLNCRADNGTVQNKQKKDVSFGVMYCRNGLKILLFCFADPGPSTRNRSVTIVMGRIFYITQLCS